MKNIAVYAGTFDPITLGHIDVVERGARIFDHVIVAVAKSAGKKPLFTLEERSELTAGVLSHLSNVNVLGFEGLLVDFAKQNGANVLLRGLRTVTDFDYEFQLASMNRHMNDSIESMFVLPAENYRNISSSLVREIAALGGHFEMFVPPLVAVALNNKFKK